MNEENHIIKFYYNFHLSDELLKNDLKVINFYNDDRHRCIFDLVCKYLNLNIYYYNGYFGFNYIFNLSNMLYKIHNPNYYRRYNHKELI